MSWARFGSLPLRSKSRLSRANGVSNAKHKDVAVWLRELDLEEYQAAFQKFQGVEELLEFSETDIKELGVKKSSHRARIISSLTCLRAKYHDIGFNTEHNVNAGIFTDTSYARRIFSENFTRKPPIRHSVAVDSRTKIQREDTL
ncbi:hypothetical protein NQ317_005199 [Molorchus minor]|uniref:SAM domain-containing protein n=1 Tax=Molorchus minor TaxID=1323400 RepID=A0ABQ9JQC8_9CUCU|nr:hypothetical protein NQ317_005199 [Molorchus minor]